MKDKEVIDLVEKELETLCTLLNVDCKRECTLEEGEEGIKYIKVNFEGDNLGYMIGNRGRHLDSLQFLLQVIMGRKFDAEYNFRVFIDVGGYRKEKDNKLEEMALQKADDARILGEEVELPPMKPSDRRIIHLALMKFADIETESRGEGMDRYIVIKPVK
ncbi:MAG: protein jag [Candidatus Dojkabacteria bacterium]